MGLSTLEETEEVIEKQKFKKHPELDGINVELTKCGCFHPKFRILYLINTFWISIRIPDE